MTRLEKEAPEAFLGFLDYLEEQRRAEEVKCSRLPVSILTRMLQEFDNSVKRRELFRAWQMLPAADHLAALPALSGEASDDRKQVRALLKASLPKLEKS